MARSKRKADPDVTDSLGEKSTLGEPWVPIYSMDVDFGSDHFQKAMANLIRQPNINSTVIMRADILRENTYDPDEGDTTFISKLVRQEPKFLASDNPEDIILARYLHDAEVKHIPLSLSAMKLVTKSEVVRRIIPRNPYKDHIINQTCIIMTSEEQIPSSVLVCYIPHIQSVEETPYYLPPVYGVGILYHQNSISVQYLPFGFDGPAPESATSSLRSLEPTDRRIRIALRLLQTAVKHSGGAKSGYEKRVNHDMVVPKIAFQDQYIALKKKYSAQLVNLWCESTDPKKHVFEDLAIAAFLIELWRIRYSGKDSFEFRDLGCGNGLLVYILNMEGYVGKGIDARARKSWASFPPHVQSNLSEQIVIPGILLRPHPAIARIVPHAVDNGRVFVVSQEADEKDATNEDVPPGTTPLTKDNYTKFSSADLLKSPQVCTTDDFPENTFVIGNHSDELTCWIPLLQYPFMVIPCCSHALTGARFRYSPIKQSGPLGTSTKSSSYGALVAHVESLAQQMGWIVEKEMLRIPSTRNAAIIATKKQPQVLADSTETQQTRILDIIALEGGAEGWVENSMALVKKPPRNH